MTSNLTDNSTAARPGWLLQAAAVLLPLWLFFLGGVAVSCRIGAWIPTPALLALFALQAGFVMAVLVWLLTRGLRRPVSLRAAASRLWPYLLLFAACAALRWPMRGVVPVGQTAENAYHDWYYMTNNFRFDGPFWTRYFAGSGAAWALNSLAAVAEFFFSGRFASSWIFQVALSALAVFAVYDLLQTAGRAPALTGALAVSAVPLFAGQAGTQQAAFVPGALLVLAVWAWQRRLWLVLGALDLLLCFGCTGSGLPAAGAFLVLAASGLSGMLRRKEHPAGAVAALLSAAACAAAAVRDLPELSLAGPAEWLPRVLGSEFTWLFLAIGAVGAVYGTVRRVSWPAVRCAAWGVAAVLAALTAKDHPADAVPQLLAAVIAVTVLTALPHKRLTAVLCTLLAVLCAVQTFWVSDPVMQTVLPDAQPAAAAPLHASIGQDSGLQECLKRILKETDYDGSQDLILAGQWNVRNALDLDPDLCGWNLIWQQYSAVGSPNTVRLNLVNLGSANYFRRRYEIFSLRDTAVFIEVPGQEDANAEMQQAMQTFYKEIRSFQCTDGHGTELTYYTAVRRLPEEVPGNGGETTS